MKKVVAAALSSAALLVSPAVFAQTGASGVGAGGDGGASENRGTVPLTPSQVETSEGAVYNPPPIVQGGAAPHLGDKGLTGRDGDTASDTAGESTGDGNDGGGSNGTGDGAGTGGTGDGANGDGGGADGAGAGAGGAR